MVIYRLLEDDYRMKNVLIIHGFNELQKILEYFKNKLKEKR